MAKLVKPSLETLKLVVRIPCVAHVKSSILLYSKAYTAAGHAATSLHAMAILEVHQTKALKELHKVKTDPGLMQKLRTATALPLQATKVTARDGLGDVHTCGTGKAPPALPCADA